MRNVSDNGVEDIKTQKCFPENYAVCYIIWKNTVEPDRMQMAIQYGAEKMQFACWITVGTNKHTHTHTNIYYLLFFHGNNMYMNAPQCYALCTLPILLL
jgi:hypothetical protein